MAEDAPEIQVTEDEDDLRDSQKMLRDAALTRLESGVTSFRVDEVLEPTNVEPEEGTSGTGKIVPPLSSDMASVLYRERFAKMKLELGINESPLPEKKS